ncbi:hypothetical protein LIER_24825 [Lithospermum erythrorhizon]|uniref:Protein TIFY n=1 Tax=Lithospermum erythrorhizon TaxID=34254 RepID=A0AAV3R685_LITER
MDSGKDGGGQKCSFSQTCSLLSQYIKEKGSVGNLTLGLSNNFQPHGASTNLFPHQTREQEKGQMIIFYDGQVMVFDEFPAEKVKEILTMANIGQKPAESASSCVNFPHFGNNLAQQSLPITPQPMINDLPIARKASLTRFLEKRKDRLTAKAPYQMGATSKPVEGKGKPWLGLGAQPPTKVEPFA